MPGEPMPAVTYDRCTKLGCCHNQISTDIAFCHHKIPSMHTYNVSEGLFENNFISAPVPLICPTCSWADA